MLNSFTVFSIGVDLTQTIPIEIGSKLKQAFSNINAALNDISQYRVKALPQMAQSILEMDQLTEQMENRIKDAEKGKEIQSNLSQLIEL
ncbi:hypothetical protein ACN08N_24655 [Photobacterium leiognathi subsp. mandapamensis]|uniref:hypothetical protein n=1 Tax=Photobacterium leiognathi TaxID=553611 RepID=UPI003AF3886D